MSTRCRSCGDPVIWLKNTRTGKRAPIDAEPDPAGNIVTFPDDGTYTVLGPSERAEATAEGVALRTNHFATCPQAGQWHKATQKAGAP